VNSLRKKRDASAEEFSRLIHGYHLICHQGFPKVRLCIIPMPKSQNNFRPIFGAPLRRPGGDVTANNCRYWFEALLGRVGLHAEILHRRRTKQIE
jgi:hypothetical protein